MENIWNFTKVTSNLGKSPESILNKYAGELNENQTDFVGLVSETRIEGENKVYFSFYIIVPKLRDYMYKLFSVMTPSLISFYPLELTHFAKDTRNTRTFYCSNEEEFETQLKALIQSPLTSLILDHLKTLADTIDHYNQ